ncbi:hypothetical protein [Amnibacterium setariae]|uniref:hypothetical protein n=1 Tax=Amnibacterium setariae TaxID=2306585 RepID=UPI00131500A6|nr:hypothetical protein [Amnibacterium setariae]
MLDADRRRRVFASIVDDLDQPRHRAYIAQPVDPLEAWLDGSALMHVRFDDGPCFP